MGEFGVDMEGSRNDINVQGSELHFRDPDSRNHPEMKEILSLYSLFQSACEEQGAFVKSPHILST